MNKLFYSFVIYSFFSASLMGIIQKQEGLEDKIRGAHTPSEVDELLGEIPDSKLSEGQSLKVYLNLASQSKKIGYALGEGHSLTKAGQLLLGQGKYDSTILVLAKAEKILKAENEFLEASKVDFSLAIAHYSLGQYDKAAETVVEDLESVKDIDGAQYNSMLRTLGEIHRGANNLGAAEHYLKLAIEHAEATDRKDALAYNLNRLGVVYYQDSKHELAKQNLERSLKLAQEINLDRAITMNLNDMGELYFTLKDYERCIELYEIALGRDMLEDDRANTFVNVARLQYQLGNFDGAIDYAQKALALSLKIGSVQHKVESVRILAESYTKMEDYRNAAKYYELFTTTNDSVYNLQVQRQLTEVETKYQTEKKELEIANLTQREALERSRKQAFMYGLIIVLILLIVVLFLVLQLNKNRRKIQQQNARLQELNNTKDKFFSIIAHDLRSPMVALQGVGQKLDFFLRKGKQDKLMEMGNKIDRSIDQLNNLLNNLLHWAASQTGGIPYHPEQFDVGNVIAENIELYQGLLEAKKLEVIRPHHPVMIYADKNTFSAILRNLLSNAIKFSNEGGQIIISYTSNGEVTSLEIKDKGFGMSQETLESIFSQSVKSSVGSKGEKGFGLGLKLTREFVDHNHGTIKLNSELGKGTTFILTFPTQGEGKVLDIGVA